MLAIGNPRLFGAVLVGWIISVILHEFAHGVVAYWGGDYTIRERGGLTLNPLQYIDPVFSIILPVVVLFLGGIPLPGGVTYIRRDLLRSRFWDTAVSLAGPAMNLILFVACALPLHPHFHWLDPNAGPEGWSHLQIFLGSMAALQLIAVILNLFPVPPLDGFQAIAPFLPDDLRIRVTTPPLSNFLFFAYFMIIWQAPGVRQGITLALISLLRVMGFGGDDIEFFLRAYDLAFRG
ncbi:MAG TPA: site-2 protease family protein [Tepidisphaeraceae bacterium]|jgi:Zn-dependent protease|nr:site-2 protease family protein [Tepidisphaeraceae bacterium]